MLLIQKIDRPYFSVEEFRNKRDKVRERLDVSPKDFSYGLTSLMHRDILKKEKKKSNAKAYSINPKLEPYVKKKKHIDYGTAIEEASKKIATNNYLLVFVLSINIDDILTIKIRTI